MTRRVIALDVGRGQLDWRLRSDPRVTVMEGVNARRLGQNRRRFLQGLTGVATTLLAHNRAQAAAGRDGGFYDIPEIAALETDAAEAVLAKREFIFDVQGHFVNPTGAWLEQVPEGARPLSGMPKSRCELADAPGDRSYLECLSGEQFVKDVFLDSGTADHRGSGRRA